MEISYNQIHVTLIITSLYNISITSAVDISFLNHHHVRRF